LKFPKFAHKENCDERTLLKKKKERKAKKTFTRRDLRFSKNKKEYKR
jgi:hypothetical protein